MNNENFGCELTMPAQGGNGQTVLYLADVEREFLGLSVTERVGLEIRRISVELRDIEQITQLRDSLDAFLRRKCQ